MGKSRGYTGDAADSLCLATALQAAVALDARPDAARQLADGYIFPRGCL